MSDAWALAICLLEDDKIVPAGTPSPEDIDRIDDPQKYIQQRFEDFFFQFERQLEGRKKKKLELNTYLLRQPNGTITVRYHNTDIITITPDNRIIVSTVGTGAKKYLRMGREHPWAHYGEQVAWHTPSTLDRINRYLPGKWRLYGKKPRSEPHTDWVWYWYQGRGGQPVEFTDGDVVLGTGELKAQAHDRKGTHP